MLLLFYYKYTLNEIEQMGYGTSWNKISFSPSKKEREGGGTIVYVFMNNS